MMIVCKVIAASPLPFLQNPDFGAFGE